MTDVCMITATPDISGSLEVSPNGPVRPKRFYTEDEYRAIKPELLPAERSLGYATAKIDPATPPVAIPNYDDFMPEARGHLSAKLPAMTFRQRDEIITDLQERLRDVGPDTGEELIKGALNKDPRLQRRFMQAFDEGFHLPEETLRRFAAKAYTNAIPATWYTPQAFDDDENFSLDRFYLTISTWDKVQVGDKRPMMQHAIAQMKRLLAAGHIDLDYLTPLKQTYDEVSAERVEVILMPYEPDMIQKTDLILSFANTQLASATREQQVSINKIIKTIDDTKMERDRLCREVWLPGMLSADEWAKVSGVQGSLLVELYPHLVAKGYAGYRDAVTNR